MVEAGDIAERGRQASEPWSRFDRWASNLFLVLALIGLVAALIVPRRAGVVEPAPAWLVVASFAIGIGEIALLYGMSVAIDRGRTWAREASVYLLYVMVLVDATKASLALLQGSLYIPLGAILAIAVLLQRPGPLPAASARDRRIALALGGLFLVLSLPGIAPVSVSLNARTGRDAAGLGVTAGVRRRASAGRTSVGRSGRISSRGAPSTGASSGESAAAAPHSWAWASAGSGGPS